MIYCNRTCKSTRARPKVINVRSFKGFDSLAFVADLESQPWEIVYLFGNPDDAWFAVETSLKDVGNRHARLRTLRVQGSQPQWMSDNIRHSMKYCDFLKRKAVKSKLDKDWDCYKSLRNKVTHQEIY